MAQSASAASTVKPGIPRWVFRWLHLIFAIPIAGYVYSPFENLPSYAPLVRFFFLPVLVLTGLWMWKGHVLRRIFSKQSPGGTTSLTSP